MRRLAEPRPLARSAASTLAILLALLFVAGQAAADIISTTGNIFLDSDNNGISDAVFSTSGLGIGTLTPSANLHVAGNAYVSGSLGIGTATPSSTMTISGTWGFSVQSVSSNTILSGNSFVLANTSSANITLTLPAASSVTGRQYTIKKTSNSYTLTVGSGGGNIESTSELSLTSSGNGYPYAQIISNGSNWYIVNRSSDGVSSRYALGDVGPGGGNVFYVSGNTYLEAAPSNWGSYETQDYGPWSTGGNQSLAVSGADGTAIGTGYQNSVDIKNQTGNVAASCPAVACRNYTGGGLSDWFLPSKDELFTLYTNRAYVNAFPTGIKYWSSSEASATVSWALWDNGTMTTGAGLTKAWNLAARPIRMGSQ